MADEPDNRTDDLGDAGKKALEEERKARRDAERQLRDTRAKLEELETASVRRDVATDKGLTEAQAKHLKGSSREELEAHADELLTAFDAKATSPVPHKPTADLKGGGDPDITPEPDASVMADRILSRGL